MTGRGAANQAGAARRVEGSFDQLVHRFAQGREADVEQARLNGAQRAEQIAMKMVSAGAIITARLRKRSFQETGSSNSTAPPSLTGRVRPW